MGAIEKVVEKVRVSGKKPAYEDYDKVGFPPEFAQAVRTIKDNRELIAQLKGEVDGVEKNGKRQPGLVDRVKEQLGERGRERVRVDKLLVLAYGGKSTNVSAKLLLQEGVSMETIEKCTEETPYVAVRIAEEK